MLALIKLTLTLPGCNAPKMSCVTLPIAPTGVVSVSPVTRQATRASQKDSATAITVSQTGMPKLACPSQASATSDTIWPTANQLMGASMRSGSLAAAERKESICPRSWNALNAVRQLSAKLSSPAAECSARVCDMDSNFRRQIRASWDRCRTRHDCWHAVSKIIDRLAMATLRPNDDLTPFMIWRAPPSDRSADSN
jgi:hypothetical protein